MSPQPKPPLRILNLPPELLLSIFNHLSIRELSFVASTCKTWSTLISETTNLHLTPNANIIQLGFPKILSKMTHLQTLKLSCLDRGELQKEELVKFAFEFKGHPTITKVDSPTSSILVGCKNCPNLKSLKIKEDMVMPIPHILDVTYENGVALIFQKLGALRILELDCPLLWAVNRFSQWGNKLGGDYLDWSEDEDLDDAGDEGVNSNLGDAVVEAFQYPILGNLKIMKLKSFNEESFKDFVYGLVMRVKLVNLEELYMGATNMCGFRDGYFGSLVFGFPNLKILTFDGFCFQGSQFAQELFKKHDNEIGNSSTCLTFLPNLRELSFQYCNFVFELARPLIRQSSRNLCESIVEFFLVGLELEVLDISNCKFQNVTGFPTTIRVNLTTNSNSIFNNTNNSNIDQPSLLTEFTMKKLTKLTLLGFGKFLPSSKFIVKFLMLKSLKIDDVNDSPVESPTSENFSSSLIAFIAKSLPNLSELDIRFTRTENGQHQGNDIEEWSNNLSSSHESTIFRSSSPSSLSSSSSSSSLSSSTDYQQTPHQTLIDFTNLDQRSTTPRALTNLTNLKLYAPKNTPNILKILAHQPNLRDLSLSYIQSNHPPPTHHHRFHLPHLKTFTLHCHGKHAPSTALSLLHQLVITAGASNLAYLRVQASKPMQFDAAVEEETGAFGEGVVERLGRACPVLRVVRVVGLVWTVGAVEVLGRGGVWERSLVEFEMWVRGDYGLDSAYENPIREFIGKYRQLKSFEITLHQQESMKKLRGCGGGGSKTVSNDEIQQADLIMQRVCEEYRVELQRLAFWIRKVRVNGASLKNEKIRFFLLRRMNRRVRID